MSHSPRAPDFYPKPREVKGGSPHGTILHKVKKVHMVPKELVFKELAYPYHLSSSEVGVSGEPTVVQKVDYSCTEGTRESETKSMKPRDVKTSCPA